MRVLDNLTEAPTTESEKVPVKAAVPKHRRNVLVVGQTPPPMNGQSLMIQELLNGEYEGLALHHVRLNFSRSTEEIGAFQARKLLVLLKTLVDIVVGRFRSRAEILYFPPAGPTLNPVVRDIFLLNSTRWLFKRTVFHFHAAGLLEIYARLPWWLKPLFNRAYGNADVAIVTTKTNASGLADLNAKAVTVIPYGIEDLAANYLPPSFPDKDEIPEILFVGILCEGKGVLTLIQACSELRNNGFQFRVTCAGAFLSEAFKQEAETLVATSGLDQVVRFPGVLAGNEKLNAFRSADIFCFPTHYHAESFGVVLVEAMSFGLPVVTTRWRGIPDVVGESGGAFVVEPNRPDLVADKLRALLQNPELRTAMGQQSRRWFCDRYTLENYRAGMERAFEAAAAGLS